MKPFMIGDRRLAFDITNADDLRRLETGFASLCAQHDRYTAEMAGEGMSASEQMRALYDMYRAFFETVFPGRGEEIVGAEPSVAHAQRAFSRFAVYLRTSLEEEAQQEDTVRSLFLGDGTASDGGA